MRHSTKYKSLKCLIQHYHYFIEYNTNSGLDYCFNFTIEMGCACFTLCLFKNFTVRFNILTIRFLVDMATSILYELLCVSCTLILNRVFDPPRDILD